MLALVPPPLQRKLHVGSSMTSLRSSGMTQKGGMASLTTFPHNLTTATFDKDLSRVLTAFTKCVVPIITFVMESLVPLRVVCLWASLRASSEAWRIPVVTSFDVGRFEDEMMVGAPEGDLTVTTASSAKSRCVSDKKGSKQTVEIPVFVPPTSTPRVA